MRLRIPILFLTCIFGFVATEARGQFPQYTAPGSLGIATLPLREQIEKALGNAPWKLGPVRVQPWVGLRDLGYVGNLFDSQGNEASDVTASFGLGLKAYLPVGPKVYIAAHVLPEYVWWMDTEDLRGWRYENGIGVFGYFNRLTVEARATSNDIQRNLSSEAEVPVDVETWSGDVSAIVDLVGPFGIFLAASQSELTHDDNDLSRAFPDDVTELDRTERTARAGIQYELEDFTLGLGVAWSEVEFDLAARDRSNSGTAPTFIFRYTGSRINADVDVAYRELEAEDGSQFVEFNDVSGNVRLTYVSASRIGGSIYGGQSVVYSLQPGTSYYEDRRIGVSAGVLVGWRTDVRAFFETGVNDYVTAPGAAIDRNDDVLSYGITAQFKVTENSTFYVSGTQSEFDSNLDVHDRDVTSLRVTLNIGGPFSW